MRRHAAPARARSLGAPDCGAPEDFTSDGLKAFATKCTDQAASDWIEETTGVPVVIDANGINWDATATAIVSAETGGVQIDFHVVNADGSMNWTVVAEDAGSIGGAAICAATGAGAAATPVCSIVGGELGKEVYAVGSALVDLFTTHDLPPPTPLPSAVELLDFTIRSLAVNERDVLSRLLAMRSISRLVRKTVIRMITYWHETTGDVVAPSDMYALLLSYGLYPPPGWATWFHETQEDYGPQEVDVYFGGDPPPCGPAVKQAGSVFSLVTTNVARIVSLAFGLEPPTTCVRGVGHQLGGSAPSWRVEAGIDADADGGTWTPHEGLTYCYEDMTASSPDYWPSLREDDQSETWAIDAWVLATADLGGVNIAGPLVIVRDTDAVTPWSAPHDERSLIGTSQISVGQTPSSGTCRAPLVPGKTPWAEVIAAAPDYQVEATGLSPGWQQQAHLVHGLCRISLNANLFEAATNAALFDLRREAWFTSIPAAVTRLRAAAINQKHTGAKLNLAQIVADVSLLSPDQLGGLVSPGQLDQYGHGAAPSEGISTATTFELLGLAASVWAAYRIATNKPVLPVLRGRR